ncbi:MAG: hypothetical protein HXY20_08855 [Acidobacteria bacterium]|nr:hypothetical protein [Acidobacteriota bacterium]
MSPSDFFKTFLEGNVPLRVRMIAARGLAPVVPAEMLQILVMLCSDEDAGVSRQACETLAGWTDEEIAGQLSDDACAPSVLEYFALTRSSDAIREAIIGNRATPPGAIARLAQEVQERLLELILENRVRLLQSPEIVQKIRLNPSATPRILRQVQEIEQEFFSGKQQSYAVGAAEQAAETVEAPAVPEPEILPEDLVLEGLPVDTEARETVLSERLRRMTVPQKVRMALVGPREARAVLVRDSNKLVSLSVLQSPKLSDSEIESYASMRNVSDEVLRQIGSSRELAKTYGVAHALVKNPKTPPMIAQRMLSRLTTRDLSLLVRDRGIPEVIRRGAQRMLSQRTSTQQKH